MKLPSRKCLFILAIATFIGFFLWGRVADSAEVGIGLGFGYASNQGARYQELMLTSDERKWYVAVTKIGADDRHNYKYWRTTVGYRVNWRSATNFSPYMRLGMAYFNEKPEDYISSHVSFDMSVGIRLWNIVELEFDQHNSTAGRSDQNEGLDAVMLRVVLPFGR